MTDTRHLYIDDSQAPKAVEWVWRPGFYHKRPNRPSLMSAEACDFVHDVPRLRWLRVPRLRKKMCQHSSPPRTSSRLAETVEGLVPVCCILCRSSRPEARASEGCFNWMNPKMRSSKRKARNFNQKEYKAEADSPSWFAFPISFQPSKGYQP